MVEQVPFEKLVNICKYFPERPLFSDAEFLHYHKDQDLAAKHPGFAWDNLAHYKEKKCLSFITGHRVQSSNDVLYMSSGVGSFGGHVFQDLDYSAIQEIVVEFIEHLKRGGYTRAQLVLPPLFYLNDSSNYFMYEQALLQNGFMLKTSYLNHHLEVGVPFREVINRDTLNEMKRRASKGNIEIQKLTTEKELEEFHHELIEDRKKFSATTTHSLEDLLYLYRHQRSKFDLRFVKIDGDWACGMLFLRTSPTCCYIFYPMVKEKFRSSSISYFVYENIYDQCLVDGTKYLDLGPSSFGFDAHHSLIRFKESLGSSTSLKKVYSLGLA